MTPTNHSDYLAIDKNYRKAARAANLSYVNDQKEGITRTKKGKAFQYKLNNKSIHDKDTLQRIRRLAIPPSWSNVWICPTDNGHLQATGTDLLGRKQYRYHADWSHIRNETKFHRLMEFGKALPKLRRRVRKDLRSPTLTAEKVIASAISLMEHTSIRIGNDGYEKMYGSYGLTTLKDRHVDFRNGTAVFSFTGKKGVPQKITLKNRKLANIIRQCRDVPGKDLFQFFDEKGLHRKIDSTMVNSYIKENSGGDFSAKDLRTWAGSLAALECLRNAGAPTGAKQTKLTVVSVLDEVSGKLGNTRSVCKKYYVHPYLFQLYENNTLFNLIDKATSTKTGSSSALSKMEVILLHLLKSYR